MVDKPHHHDIETYIDIIRHYHEKGFACPTIWGQDLDAAYRQIPVLPDAMAFTVLVTPEGPTLWRHTACPFGAAASVWSFNRFADSLMVLARRLLLVPSCHFVDDFMSVDPMSTATSSCDSFKALFGHLGLHMKPAKEQRPAHQQKMLGVQVSVEHDQIRLSACESRRQKVACVIDHALKHNTLSAAEAQRCAGKLAFLATTFFGAVGRAALQPLYSRGHGLGQASHDHLTVGLRHSLRLLRHLIHHAKPRSVPLGIHDAQTAVVYTDAFFAPCESSRSDHSSLKNGWGYVLRVNDEVFYAHGELPASFVRQFAPRKAFIYMLEIMAVLIAATSHVAQLPALTTFFIDNQAGKYALTKGYGRCEAINILTSAFWLLAEQRQWHPHLVYVRSGLNISDPVSRGDLSGAEASGWTRVYPDITPLLKVLSRSLEQHDGDLMLLQRDLSEFFQFSAPG